MLTEIVVQDLGVIERAEVTFGAGGTALTGETGAGKTLVVAAAGLLLGDRADRTLVRSGAERARVEGRIVVPSDHPVSSRLKEAGLLDATNDAIELVVSRTVGSGGGGKARINGRLVTVAQLSEICGSLIEIAGQQAHQTISKPAQQRALLDALAGPECSSLARDVAAAVGSARAAARRAAELRAAERERARELDALTHEIDEIDKVSLRRGEMAELREAAGRLEHAEMIAANLARAAAVIHGESGVEEMLSEAEGAVRAAAEKDPEAMELATRLEGARLELADVALELRGRISPADPESLEQTRARLDVLARLQRKYGEDEEAIAAYLERARNRARELRDEQEESGGADEEADRLAAEALFTAERLSSLRHSAAETSAEEVARRLFELALPGARFRIDLTPRKLYEGGLEEVTFLVSTNPGEEELPLSKVASGGELARLALALHLVSSEGRAESRATTMIFDEVDAGVAGGAAGSIGRSLARLSADREIQTVVVTHLPQVAAFADHHLKISKDVVSGRSRAVVEPLSRAGRIEELSRMLAGMPESGSAREHARELLDLASGSASVGT